jgi:hypothetical protein
MNLLKSDSNLTFVIAPHEIHQEEIMAWKKQIELKSI